MLSFYFLMIHKKSCLKCKMRQLYISCFVRKRDQPLLSVLVLFSGGGGSVGFGCVSVGFGGVVGSAGLGVGVGSSVLGVGDGLSVLGVGVAGAVVGVGLFGSGVGVGLFGSGVGVG